jgi:hypothetical protein
MNERIIQLVKSTPLYWLAQWHLLRTWERHGRTGAPPRIVKLRTLEHYAQVHNLRVFVETGTALGDMIARMRRLVDRVYSIELDQKLFQRAQRRFGHDAGVMLLCGDSGLLLQEIMTKVDRPALFWLDAHYMGEETVRGANDTPIIRELDIIFSAPDLKHVIVIDDARLFGVDKAYPTVAELQSFVEHRRPGAKVTVADDMIRIVPAQ